MTKDKLISLSEEKIKRSPHNSGWAVCVHCRHKWIAIEQAGTYDTFKCPECGLPKGVYIEIIEPDVFWRCGCGCNHFCISGKGNAICINCGEQQDFFN